MQINQVNWKVKDPWSRREFLLLMLIEFVLIIGCVKFFIQPILTRRFEHDLYAGTFIGLVMAIILILSIYFIALRPKRLSWGELGIRSFNMRNWRLIILYTVILMTGIVLITVVTSLIGNTWENSKTEAMQQDISFITLLIAIVSASVISPIYEEIFYRGFLFRWFRTRLGFIGAVFFSSFIFSIVHIPTYNVMPVAFFSGIIFAIAYEKTNSIWPSVLIHGLSNGIMVLLSMMG